MRNRLFVFFSPNDHDWKFDVFYCCVYNYHWYLIATEHIIIEDLIIIIYLFLVVLWLFNKLYIWITDWAFKVLITLYSLRRASLPPGKSCWEGSGVEGKLSDLTNNVALEDQGDQLGGTRTDPHRAFIVAPLWLKTCVRGGMNLQTLPPSTHSRVLSTPLSVTNAAFLI